MRRVTVALLVLLTIFSCSKKSKIVIKGNIEGANGGIAILKILEVNQERLIDTIKLNQEGEFSYSIKLERREPNFYYLYHNERQLLPLLIEPGEVVTIKSDTLGKKRVITGSPESERLNLLTTTFSAKKRLFRELFREMESAQESGNLEEANSLNQKLGKLYVTEKQNTIREIYSHPYSASNITLLFSGFNENYPLFADPMDFHLFKRVADSLSTLYPQWIYLESLQREIKLREGQLSLNRKIEEAEESGFPDISLPDIKSESRALSELRSNVIILSFWTATESNQRMLNLEYKELYEKYHNQGLEIYQVSLDLDKTIWATALSEQNIPWISVCDGEGPNSIAVTTYNISELPTNFIIDREGTVVAKNVYDRELEQMIIKLLK